MKNQRHVHTAFGHSSRSSRAALLAAFRPVSAALALCAAATVGAQTASTFEAAQRQSVPIAEVAFGLRHPWSLAFLPGGEFLVTEREGAMRIIDAYGRVGPPLRGVPDVAVSSEGGLLDVALAPDFAQTRQLYFCFSQPDLTSYSRSGTALAAATLSERNDSLENVRVLFEQQPKVRSEQHFGCRIALADDGSMFLTLGERAIAPAQAQRTTNHLGTIVRIQASGQAHPANPFAHKPGGLPEIWSWGHRNPQGAVVTPDGALWTHEAGPMGGDELNLTKAGGNYGWPRATYGRGIGAGPTYPGTEQPVFYWPHPVGPSGLAYLRSDRYGPQWQHSFFIGSLLQGVLIRLKLEPGQPVQEQWYTLDGDAPVRDVREGPDGLLYVLTDGEDGRLLRLEPPAQTPAPVTDSLEAMPFNPSMEGDGAVLMPPPSGESNAEPAGGVH
ncbi:PQQ-dependent sugar dehydrogenase [Lampropedia cohaerens]|uniref:PQQ-dependent sugar dehydrogenase n=1 Tax=Lampropedia cohaerens TaxID=1610491 RepID=UPI0012E3A7D0|nr:PQQ-dependent sugar dehydrogenase [Lampropedia cohaerens]